MRFAICICVAILSVVVYPRNSVYAYSEAGHKIVASIAYRSMTASQRERVIEVLEHHPRFQQDFRNKMPAAIRDGSVEARQEWLFQQAAIWPDLAREFQGDNREKFHRGNWHFINRPIFLQPADEIELGDSIDVNLNLEPPSNSIDSKQMNVIQAIVNSSRIVADDDRLASIKAVHICWLLHNIGDIHQPLHSSALFSRRLFPQGDKGGNSITTTVNNNLHAVWDRTFGTDISMQDARDVASGLLSRDDLQAEVQAASSSLDPQSMWDDSIAAAVDFVYTPEVFPNLRAQESTQDPLTAIPLSSDYLQNRRRVCEKMVVRAGVRCASYLAAVTGDQPGESIALSAVRDLDPGRLRSARSRTASGDSARIDELERQVRELKARLGGSSSPSDTIPDAVPFPGVRTPGAVPANQPIVFESFDPKFPPPAGTATFELSQEFPLTYDADEKFPWMEIDFRTHSVSYLQSILKYCFEGNIDVHFRGQDNTVRKWFHAPWMHDDSAENPRRAGREYHHGLTSERRSRPFELHPLQSGEGFPDKRIQNWAISLYSPRGGHTLGRIWRTRDGIPDPYQANFPDNTVSFKLLFTAAPVEQVPYLEGSLEWTANINPITPPMPFTRVDQKVRLLQVDVAVKDPRVAESTGWIFGTFIYDGSRPGNDWSKKLVPVGLSWGDDGHEKSLLEKQGSFINPRLRSTVINHELLQPDSEDDWGDRAYVRHHGLGGRLNGPVDNLSSSCISCHGRAGLALARPGSPLALINKSGSVAEQIEAFDIFFSPIRPGTQLVRAKEPQLGETEFVTVDYSLQVSMGIRNFHAARQAASPAARASGAAELPRPTRGEDN